MDEKWDAGDVVFHIENIDVEVYLLRIYICIIIYK